MHALQIQQSSRGEVQNPQSVVDVTRKKKQSTICSWMVNTQEEFGECPHWGLVFKQAKQCFSKVGSRYPIAHLVYLYSFKILDSKEQISVGGRVDKL